MRPDAARSGELFAWLASAREWLGEFAEEGIERIEAAPAPIAASAPEAHPRFAEQPSWSGETTLEAVREALGDCKRCRLCEQRTKIVFGDGNPHAELLFVGEGPG
ncbi:MAG: hypothetical protein ACREI7_03280, partial [Myxococcota bacterium]